MISLLLAPCLLWLVCLAIGLSLPVPEGVALFTAVALFLAVLAAGTCFEIWRSDGKGIHLHE